VDEPRNGSTVAEASWPAGAGDSLSSGSRGCSADTSPGRNGAYPELEARILESTRHAPSTSTHWTTRKLAKRLGISHMMVARVWRKHGLQPHRIERYMASNDPDFEKKAADIMACI